MDGFLKIATTGEFEPGSSRVIAFLGRKVRVDRDVEGHFTATDLVCRHQNFDLSTSSIEKRPEGEIVTCPAHGWRYNLRTGECLNEAWAKLRRREVRVEGSEIYLAIQLLPLEDAPPTTASSGDDPATP